jgi:hypothetical protein
MYPLIFSGFAKNKKGSALLRNPLIYRVIISLNLHNTASATLLEKYDDDVNVSCFSFSEANVWNYMNINQIYFYFLK